MSMRVCVYFSSLFLRQTDPSRSPAFHNDLLSVVAVDVFSVGTHMTCAILFVERVMSTRVLL